MSDSMETVILSRRDLRQLVHQVGIDRLMDDMIERLQHAFATYDPVRTPIPPRSGFTYQTPQVGLLEWMPAMEMGKKITIKVVGYHPHNPERMSLPTILSTISLYDTANGHLVGLADATFLTALRTGAASAIASRVLARPQSRTLGLIGCGAGAVTQLHALSRLFPLEKVLVYDLDGDACRSFADRTRFVRLPIEAVEGNDLGRLVGDVDILCTSTTVAIGGGPVFADTSTRDWLHINAVGADFPGKTEIPAPLLKRAFVCPDFTEQALKEGECQNLAAGQIGPALYQLIQRGQDHAPLQERLSVFDSTGWALEDQEAMKMLIDYAHKLGLGTLVNLESVADDPKDPYDFFRPDIEEG